MNWRPGGFHPYFTLGLVNMHLALLVAPLVRPRPLDLWLLLGGYVWFGLASSLYYHRHLAHRGFELALPIKLLLLLGGLIGLSGDPVRWVAIHRFHHQRPDRPDDIHSPAHGFWHAHLGWIAGLDLDWVARVRPLARDVAAIPYVRVFQSLVIEAVPHVAYLALVRVFAGPQAVIWGVYVPICLTFHLGWMAIASLCHSPGMGRRPFETPDTSQNIWWLGIPSFGEAFHNNHHACPRRARHGLRWFDPDPTRVVLWCLERLGLAWDVFWHHPPGEPVTPEQLPAGLDLTAVLAVVPDPTVEPEGNQDAHGP